VILLDEPLNSLDPVQIAEVSTLLRSLPWQPAVVVSSHVVAHVLDLVDDIAVMSAGSLVARGPLAEFFGAHGDDATPAVALAVAAAEADVRVVLEPAFRLDDVSTRGGVTRLVVRPGPGGPGAPSPDALTAEVVQRLSAQGISVVEARPRRLLLTEFV
jgi:ABC-type multidrug transport system ATPase subunit